MSVHPYRLPINPRWVGGMRGEREILLFFGIIATKEFSHCHCFAGWSEGWLAGEANHLDWLTYGWHTMRPGWALTATAESIWLLFPTRRLLLRVQMVRLVILGGHRWGAGCRKAQGRTRRADCRRTETCRFYVQRWRGFVIHFHSI